MATSFDSADHHKAFAVICQRRWQRLQSIGSPVLVLPLRVGPAVHMLVFSDADRDCLEDLKQGSHRERAPATAYYELPAEYPKVLPGPVTHDMRLRSYKTWHTEVGTTAAWQRHVCAVCDLGKWEQEMRARPFTVLSLERAICGVPVHAAEWPWNACIESASDDHTLATELGWSDAIWCGAEALGEELCAHYPSHDILYSAAVAPDRCLCVVRNGYWVVCLPLAPNNGPLRTSTV